MSETRAEPKQNLEAEFCRIGIAVFECGIGCIVINAAFKYLVTSRLLGLIGIKIEVT